MRTELVGIVLVLYLHAYLSQAQYTQSDTGCECNYDRNLTTCACCEENGCQCPYLSPTSSQMCEECGREADCPSDLNRACAFTNGEGCFIDENTRKSVFSEAGLFCAAQEGHLPNIKNNRVWNDMRDYAVQRDWTAVWTGARVRDFDWQWTVSKTHVLLQGCYADIVDNPDLSVLVEIHDNVTAESCIQQCADMGYSYAGVQFETVSTEGLTIRVAPCCRCDNNQGYSDHGDIYSQRPLVDCNEPCVSAEPSAFACGAHNKHLVFKVGGIPYDAWDYTDSTMAHCAMLNTTSHLWVKTNCTVRSNHVCEYRATSEEECSAIANGNWVVDKCITIHTDNQSWHHATRQCARLRGHLIQIDNEPLNEALVDLLSGTDVLWWIGLTNRQLTWTDGTPVTYMRWAAGEPRIDREHDQCVELHRSRQFTGKMEQCSDDNEVICQLTYGWTDSDYQDYIDYYETIDDSHISGGDGGDGGDDGGGGGGGGNSPDPKDNNNNNDDESTDNNSRGSSNAIYIGIGIGAAVVIIVVVLFVIIIIRQRKFHRKKEKLMANGVSNGGFSGPGISRGESYKLRRQESVYEKIDDTYERPEPGSEGANGNGVPASYAGLKEEGYMGLDQNQIAPKEKPQYQTLTDPNAPELPPRPEAGYTGLTNSESAGYTVPSLYTDLEKPEDGAYAGLDKNTAGATDGAGAMANETGATEGGAGATSDTAGAAVHIEGVTTEGTYASTGATVSNAEDTDRSTNDIETGSTSDPNQNDIKLDSPRVYLEVISDS